MSVFACEDTFGFRPSVFGSTWDTCQDETDDEARLRALEARRHGRVPRNFTAAHP